MLLEIVQPVSDYTAFDHRVAVCDESPGVKAVFADIEYVRARGFS